jgi:hypothetical protein
VSDLADALAPNNRVHLTGSGRLLRALIRQGLPADLLPEAAAVCHVLDDLAAERNSGERAEMQPDRLPALAA